MQARPHTCTVAGHFGELLQGRLGPDGPLVLVTLPAPTLCVTADVVPGPAFGLHCAGGERPLSRRQAARLHRALGFATPRGRLVVRSDMPAGGGAGSSTAALLATAGAFAATASRPLPEPGRLARICLALEGATDPLMHAEPSRLLWAPREARVVAPLPPLPALEIVGGFLGQGQSTDPTDLRFADVADLVDRWAPAAGRGDLGTLAQLATRSAERNVCLRGGPDLAPLIDLAGRLGGLGVVAAHTGSARGLIFAPRHGAPEAAPAMLRAIGLRAITRFRLAGPRPLR